MKNLMLLSILITLTLCAEKVDTMYFDDPKFQKELTDILGSKDNNVFHAVVPFEFGFDAGGSADVYIYRNHINGNVYITGNLIGIKQKESDAGNYEFMICFKKDNKWGPELISKLSYYSLDASINSGETMNLGSFSLPEHTIKAVIFDKYSKFKIKNKDYGLMLLIGITEDELEWKEEHGGTELISKLKEKKIYPFTDLKRKSIFK